MIHFIGSHCPSLHVQMYNGQKVYSGIILKALFIVTLFMMKNEERWRGEEMIGQEARQEELWWRDNEIKEWLRVEGEKKHFKSLTISN